VHGSIDGARRPGMRRPGFIIACFMSLSGDWSGLFSREAASHMLALVTSFSRLNSLRPSCAKQRMRPWNSGHLVDGNITGRYGGLFCALPAAGLWALSPKASPVCC